MTDQSPAGEPAAAMPPGRGGQPYIVPPSAGAYPPVPPGASLHASQGMPVPQYAHGQAPVVPPVQRAPSGQHAPAQSKLLRTTMWIAIGAIILAALVCVAWIFIDEQTEIIGRAFLMVMLLAGFAGAVMLEMNLADGRRRQWVTALAIAGWVVCLAVGAVKIWLPDEIDGEYAGGTVRFAELLVVVLIVVCAVGVLRLVWQAMERANALATRIIAIAGSVFTVALAAMLALYFTVPRSLEYTDLYWRTVIALAVLATVGTVLVPLVNALTNPRPRQQPYPPGTQFVVRPWPTFPDGRPLPAAADGTPDFRAYPNAMQGAGVIVPQPAEGVPIVPPQPGWQ